MTPSSKNHLKIDYDEQHQFSDEGGLNDEEPDHISLLKHNKNKQNLQDDSGSSKPEKNKKITQPIDEEMGAAYTVNNDSQEIEEELIPDVSKELKALTNARTCCSHFEKLSQIDRDLSDWIQSNNNTFIEAIFFCIPAHLFNRSIILAPMGICLILGAIYHDKMLEVNGFKPVGERVSE